MPIDNSFDGLFPWWDHDRRRRGKEVHNGVPEQRVSGDYRISNKSVSKESRQPKMCVTAAPTGHPRQPRHVASCASVWRLVTTFLGTARLVLRSDGVYNAFARQMVVALKIKIIKTYRVENNIRCISRRSETFIRYVGVLGNGIVLHITPGYGIVSHRVVWYCTIRIRTLILLHVLLHCLYYEACQAGKVRG